MDINEARQITQGDKLIFKIYRSGKETVEVQALGPMNREREIPVVTLKATKHNGRGTQILAPIARLTVAPGVGQQMAEAAEDVVSGAVDRMRTFINKIGEGLK